MQIQNLTNDQLLSKTEQAVRTERKATAEIVRLFQEIQSRRLFLERGFPSLFEMATKHFGYCAGSAMRRINSMRLMTALPEVEAKLETGELSLSAAAQVQTFFHAEAKSYSRAEKIELVTTCLNKSTREIEKELCRRNPEREKRETVRPTSDTRVRLSFSISDELNEKLDHLRALLSHTEAIVTLESLLERLAEFGLEKLDPKRRAERSANRREANRKTVESRSAVSDADVLPAREVESAQPPRLEVNGASTVIMEQAPAGIETAERGTRSPIVRPYIQSQDKISRNIPAAEKHEAMNTYDGAGCEFVDLKTGNRCSSQHFLQFDHIKSHSEDGPNKAVNLQMLCAAHNRLKWSKRSHANFRIRDANCG